MPYLTKTFYFCCIVLTLFIPVGLSAQIIENNINLYGINFPQEKIHIHFDKETYLPGETIWFKAYLFEEDIPSARSTNFYAALYDENGKLIQQQLCPVFSAAADGHFDIPDSLQSKQLICRAYTTWMLNFDTTFLFTKAIRLINNDAKADNSKQLKTTSLQFFPEGGDIIEGTRNTIAFKANYNNGLPFEINGVIKKQQTGEVIMPLQATHDGMGRFDLEVQPNENFYAEWADDKGMLQQKFLPKAKTVGVSLKLIVQKNNLIFNVVNKLPGNSLHVLMYMYQKVFYKTDLLVPAAEPFTGTVPVSSLPTGTMQLTVFDAGWQPVAERIAFINNNNYTLGTTITNTEISTAKRGKNHIEIEVADTVPANLSLSITDAALNSDATNSTIITNLLLGGDVKGYIHNPVYYFANNTDAALKANLDLVMLTHGWRRYNWDNLLAGKMPAIRYAADNYLSFYGQVDKAVMQKTGKDEFVNLIIKSKDSTQNFYVIKPDSLGLLRQSGFIFYDTARVLFSFNKSKQFNTQMAFSTSNFTHNQPTAISNYSNYFIPDTTGIAFNKTASLFNYYKNNKEKFNTDKTLQAIVVKSGGRNNWKNDPMLKMDEKYADFEFKGLANSFSLDVLHDEMAQSQFDVYNYVLGKIPTVSISNKGGVKAFVIKRGYEELPLVLFINGREAENEEVSRINIEDVAYIKHIPKFAGRAGLPPALAIYMKKGEDLIDRRPKDTDLKLVKIVGYSPVKEFYAPDYSQTNTTMGTDARTTLLWQPYILTNAANRKIQVTFYNNDFSKKLKLVLEGINDEGKMIHIEKFIE